MHYSYTGPVTLGGKVIQERWSGSTSATSESKARSNLIFRYKNSNNMSVRADVGLPGKFVSIDY